MRLPSIRDRERVLRRLLGLPGEAPDPVGFRFVACENGMSQLERLDPDDADRQWDAWHREGRRARLADLLAHLPGRCRQRIMGVLWAPASAITARLALRAVLDARQLVFNSYYLHPRNPLEVEGFLTAPAPRGLFWSLLGRRFADENTFRVGITVLSARALADLAAEDWNGAEILVDGGVLMGSTVNLIVPAPDLDADTVREALQRWYVEQVEYRHGHWAPRQRRLPDIRVAASFGDEIRDWTAPDAADHPLQDLWARKHATRRRRFGI